METWVRAVVEAIHSSRARAVIYLAGGASQALGWLLSVPGASGSVLEVIVPYSRASMAQLLGKVNAPPSESLCSPTREFVSCLLGELALDTRTNSLDGELVLFVLTIVFQLPLQFTSKQAAEGFLDQPKYYGGDYSRMLEILLQCKNTSTTFLVGGREIEGVFKVLEDLDIPGELRDMFISIPEEKFRMDISSTEIRKSQGL